MVTDPLNGSTALHVAVTVNLDEMVTLLLENGASSIVQDNDVHRTCTIMHYIIILQGCTALMKVCEHGHLQSLEALTMKSLSLQGNNL